MAIPDRVTARAILDSFDLPEGVVRHSEGVRRVAAEAARLVAQAVPVDVDLVEAAALLHDIDKLETRRSGEAHGIAAARRLEELGYEELAIPVASHPIACLLDEERYPRGWPSVLLAVADRLVAQEFVSIDERLDDMMQRYPQHAESIEAARRPSHALFAEVAEVAGLTPTELEERLRSAWREEA